ncbi:MAG: HigA family addiction module antitoxin [Alkalispirochaeta sp.]
MLVGSTPLTLKLPPRIDSIIKGRSEFTADTAIRLSRGFGTTPGFWLNMQSRYDLETPMNTSRCFALLSAKTILPVTGGAQRTRIRPASRAQRRASPARERSEYAVAE